MVDWFTLPVCPGFEDPCTPPMKNRALAKISGIPCMAASKSTPVLKRVEKLLRESTLNDESFPPGPVSSATEVARASEKESKIRRKTERKGERDFKGNNIFMGNSKP